MKQFVFGVILGSLLFGGAAQANAPTTQQYGERRWQLHFSPKINQKFLVDQDTGHTFIYMTSEKEPDGAFFEVPFYYLEKARGGPPLDLSK